MRPSLFPRLAPALALAALAALPAAAQEAPPEATFGELIEVRVVNVEVVVTDRDGNRVSGLTAGDFKLTVDGQPAPIEYFTEVVGGEAVAPAAGAPAAPVTSTSAA